MFVNIYFKILKRGKYKLFKKYVVFHFIEKLYNIPICKLEIKDEETYITVGAT